MPDTRRQTRSFGMHPNLLMDVISRQAGSISKSLLEAAMNSVDAGASRCEITLEADRMEIRDDGRGFQSFEEIEAHFETFGTPHQEGDAVYGRFRMGRGQLMAFGRNLWSSNVFRMDVDVKNRGLDYDLHEVDPAHATQGCTIQVELYEPMKPSDLDRTLREFREMAAWVRIPVILNAKTVSRDPADAEWDQETDDAYISLSDSKTTLNVYNLGVLVCRYPAHLYGVGGTVVAKQPLQVNFARNDVQRACPVWGRIARLLQAHARQNTLKKTRLTEAERQNQAEQALAGEYGREELGDLKLITDVAGRHHRFDVLLGVADRHSQRNGNQIVIAKRGDQLAETAQKRGLCLAIAEETLERFDVSDGAELLACVGGLLDRAATHGRDFNTQRLKKIPVVTREELGKSISDDHAVLKDSELKPAEKRILEAIRYANTYVTSAVRASPLIEASGQRKIVLGVSETALAWTDGRSFIAFDRRYAQLVTRGYTGCFQLALTMLHEYLHDSADTGSHTHDFTFYEAFHEIAGDHEKDWIGRAATSMAKRFAHILEREDRKPTSAMLRQADVQQVVERTAPRVDLADDTAA